MSNTVDCATAVDILTALGSVLTWEEHDENEFDCHQWQSNWIDNERHIFYAIYEAKPKRFACVLEGMSGQVSQMRKYARTIEQAKLACERHYAHGKWD